MPFDTEVAAEVLMVIIAVGLVGRFIAWFIRVQRGEEIEPEPHCCCQCSHDYVGGGLPGAGDPPMPRRGLAGGGPND
jgi:hypothetical protein